MAKATIRVKQFEYEVEGSFTCEDELIDDLSSLDLGERAIEYAEVISAEYDKIDEDEDEWEDDEDISDTVKTDTPDKLE